MEKKKKIDRIIETFRNYIHLKEDVMMGVPPTNNISSGNIAKYDPLMKRVTRRYAKGGTKSRKRWLDFLKNK